MRAQLWHTIGGSVPAPGPETLATAGYRAPNGGVDDSPVYVVSDAHEYEHHVSAATKLSQTRDAAGAEVVISRSTADQLAGFHERDASEQASGKRCPGFRAFSSRADAEEFIANDLSTQGIEQALALPAIDNEATVTPWLGQVQEPRIRVDINALSTTWPNRDYASTYGKQASAHIKDEWARIAGGRSDVTVAYDSSCSNCGVQQNVTMTVQGTENPDEVVVIGGHLDSISDSGAGDAMQAPGADDNASGTATLTEVARAALANGWKPQRMTPGSITCGYACSDHASWTSAGYPASMMSEEVVTGPAHHG